MDKAIVVEMERRVAAGLDPITGKAFKTCAPHTVSVRGKGVVACDGCGRPVRLDADGAWEHA